MLFNSFNFWLVFPFIFVIYWAIPKRYNRARNIFLLVVSYLLYMNWKPSFAVVLLAVTAICYGGGYLLDIQSDAKRKKTLCRCFAVLGLLPLLVFKYYNFLNYSLTGVLEAAALHFALLGLNWAIPVGISFFTFQAVGYLLDVYHQRVPAEKNFLDFALFVSFFPQVTSGPISKASELLPQIKSTHTFSYEQGRDGLKLLLWGMFLKVVLADRLGDFVDTVYEHFDYYTSITCAKASLAYTIQIYCDFAGYSLMAIGIAKTLGFDLINNFERPYLAASVTEFWKRWHISLTRWLTTHVYINLGGNRCSKLRQYWNIMVTFLVSGLWHGANWTFVVWGALHGVLQIIEKALGIAPKGRHYDRIERVKVLKPVRILVTFLLVSFAWVFFRMPSLGDAAGLIGRMFTSFGGQAILAEAGNADKVFMMVGIAILFAYEFWKEFIPNRLVVLNNRYLRFVVYVCLSCMILCMGVHDASSFIYVSF